MKIIEALKELPLLEKRISKNQGELRTYASRFQRNESDVSPFDTDEKQSKEVAARLQRISDLVDRKAKLRCQLYITNASTPVTIGKQTKMIAEWIEYREKGFDSILAGLRSLSTTPAENERDRAGSNVGADARIVKYYSESERNTQITEVEETLNSIDSTLEIVNATTDLME